MRLIDLEKLGIGLCNPDVFEDKGYAHGWNAAIKLLFQAEEVKPQGIVWHSVADGMPSEDGKDYLITLPKNRTCRIAVAELVIGGDKSRFDGYNEVLAWAELPAPYDGG